MAQDWPVILAAYERTQVDYAAVQCDPVLTAAKAAWETAFAAMVEALKAEPNGIVSQGKRYTLGTVPGSHFPAVHVSEVKPHTATPSPPGL